MAGPGAEGGGGHSVGTRGKAGRGSGPRAQTTGLRTHPQGAGDTGWVGEEGLEAGGSRHHEQSQAPLRLSIGSGAPLPRQTSPTGPGFKTGAAEH